jgi:eukaryotic-like serine/threonine-protein kinase
VTPERLRQVEELYHAALEDRAALDNADPELRREVESLLKQEGASLPSLPKLADDSTVTQLAVGALLGPYKIEARIGAGGMGEVYRAVDTRLDRKVAIKISARQFSERFEREARAIAALNHPHICTLYDVGSNYLVMELVEGETLKGPLPLDRTLKYGGQICDALDAAHKKGITHRDLKPGNIMVTKNGVKVLDFGLAKSLHDETLTVANAVMGTPRYMAPEQKEGKECDARTDIYALGLVLREMVTDFPPHLAHVVENCIANDPDDRWQAASDVRRELEWAATSPAARSPAPLGWIAAAVVLAAAMLFFALSNRRTPVASETVRFSIYPPEKTSLSGALNNTVPVPQLALSPDGRAIVFAAADVGAKPILWLRTLDEVAARPLPETEDAESSFWSWDGRWVGFFADGKLKTIPASGGPVHVVAEGIDNKSGAWGPDDTILFGTTISGIYRVPSAGGTATPVTKNQEGSHRFPQFLPDGRHFLFTVRGQTEQRGIYAGSLDGKTQKLLPGIDSSALYVAGYLLYLDGNTLVGRAFDADRLELKGQPFAVAERVGRSSTGYGPFSASRTGVLAHASAILRLGRLTWFDRGGNPLNSPSPEGDYNDFRLSPDEKTLAATLADPRTGTTDIWLTDLARGSTSRLTSGPLVNANLVWSPDGARILFRTNRHGSVNEFYQTSAAGGGNEEPVLLEAAERAAGLALNTTGVSDWSPDARNVVFSAAESSFYHLWLLPLDSRKPVRFSRGGSDEIQANFSPDGHFVAYASSESGRYEVQVRTFPLSDRKWTVSSNGGYEPRWRGDGREIYYLSEDRKLMAVSVDAGPLFGVPKALFQTRAYGAKPLRTNYVPSREGKRFLVNTQSGGSASTPITVVLNWQAGIKK